MTGARARVAPPAGERTRAWIWERWHDDSFAPGAVLDDGTFVRFAGHRMLAVRFWGPDAGAWTLDGRRGGPWVPEEPWLDVSGPFLQRGRARRPATATWQQLCLPFPGDDLAQAWNQRAELLPLALAAVPSSALRQVERLEPAFQWRMLRWLDAAGHAGTELSESNLALATLVAAYGERHGLDARQAARWRRRELAGALGLPEREASVRVLRKVHARPLRPALAARVASWLRDPQLLRRIAHARTLGLGCAMFRSARELDWFSDALLGELLGTNHGSTLELLERFSEAARRLQARGYPGPSPVGSMTRLAVEAETMSARLEALGDLPASRRLPPAPIPDLPGRIEALRRVGDIDREARLMRHCVRELSAEAVRGGVALYRVLRPERATLMLQRERGTGAWVVAQLKRRANASPSEATTRAVASWLARGRLREPR